MNTIEFPVMHLKFSIDRVAFSLFGISIYWYGIIISAAFLLAVLLALRASKRYGINSDDIIYLVWFAVPVAIICARLYYVIPNWSEFKDNIISVINIRQGGLGIYGGIIGAFATSYVFARVKKIPPLKLYDFGVPYLALAQSIGRWGNFVNQEAYGTHTTLPWGMSGGNISDGPVHPTFLYESLWNISIFAFLIWYRSKKKKTDGEVLFLYMILYGFGRFFIEGLRTDSLMIGSLRISQVLAFLFVVAFSVAFYVRRKKLHEVPEVEDEIDVSSYGSVLAKLKEEETAVSEMEPASVSNLNSEGNGESEEVADEVEAG